MIHKALIFAGKKHQDQKDDAGYPYTKHLKQVQQILNVVTSDPEVLAAGLLHDTLEDTQTTYDELVNEFGVRVANLVQEVTHQPGTNGHSFPNLKSREAIMIKFADRLSNVSRMEAWDDERRQAYLNSSKFWKES